MADNLAYEKDGEVSTSFANNVESPTEENKYSDESKAASEDINEIPKPYAGMPKEVLLHYSRQKKFVWARNILTGAVILAILTLLAMVIALIAVSPACLQFWQTSPIYQIYPKSFKDNNGDGIGDLKGIESKLDYLQELGIETVWLNPIYQSPQNDNGYDVSDYRAIDPQFGTMEEIENLITALHGRGMKIVMDFVPNHTSNQHAWFNASSDPSHPDYEKYKDYYVWVDSTDGTSAGIPNNWESVFSDVEETAWEWNEKRQQFYYHAFLKEQPDLNGRNEKVLEELKDILRFWLEKGVDGFRVDAITFLFEDVDRRDETVKESSANKPELGYEDLWHNYTENQPGIHEVIADWRNLLKQYSTEPGVYRFMETEVYDSVDVVVQYYGTPEAKEADFPMNFQLIDLGDGAAWTAASIEATVMEWMQKMPAGKWPNWVIGNHDNSRVWTRLGEAKAKLAAVLTMTLSGTPGMYYGEEIGMNDTNIENPSDFRDPERTPMQWDNSPYAGFCSNCTPWLPVNPNYETLNVENQQGDSTSMYALYKKLISMRSGDLFLRGSLCVLESTSKSFLFVREMPGTKSTLVAINFDSNADVITDLHSKYGGHFPSSGTRIFSSNLEQSVGNAVNLASFNVDAEEAIVVEFKPEGSKARFSTSSTWANRCFVSTKVRINVLGLLEVY